MKKTTTFLAMCIAATMAQAAVNFPLNYSTIFATSATNGNVLELSTTQAVNTWSQGNFSKTTGIASPSVENSTMSYSTYIDNNKGKTILLNSTSSTYTNAYIGNSAFTLTTSTTDLVAGTYYLSFLLNVSEAQNINSNTAAIIGFDKYSNGSSPRGRVSIMPSTINAATEYKLYPGTAGSLTELAAATGLVYGTTYLIVLKYQIITASSTAAECAVSLFVNPTIGAVEPSTIYTVLNTGVSNADCIRSYTVFQQPGLTAKIAGIRLSTSWSEVVKADTVSSVKSFEENRLNLFSSNGIISADLSDFTGNVNAKIFTLNGQLHSSFNLIGGGMVSFNQNLPTGLYLVSIEGNGVTKNVKLHIK
jgi:hypothetical protein